MDPEIFAEVVRTIVTDPVNSKTKSEKKAGFESELKKEVSDFDLFFQSFSSIPEKEEPEVIVKLEPRKAVTIRQSYNQQRDLSRGR